MYKIKLTISINQWGFKVNPAKNKNDRLKNGNISYFLKKKSKQSEVIFNKFCNNKIRNLTFCGHFFRINEVN